jgi:hypothetical protein
MLLPVLRVRRGEIDQIDQIAVSPCTTLCCNDLLESYVFKVFGFEWFFMVYM